MVYKTKGVCSQSIDVEVENGIVKTRSVHRRLQRKHPRGVFQTDRRHGAKEAIKTLEGIRCGMRPTSCPGSAGSGLKSSSLQRKTK